MLSLFLCESFSVWWDSHPRRRSYRCVFTAREKPVKFSTKLASLTHSLKIYTGGAEKHFLKQLLLLCLWSWQPRRGKRGNQLGSGQYGSRDCKAA